MHKTLPIITTTSRSGGNPGDTYIGTGLQWLVEQVTGPDTPWYLVSKFTEKAFVKELPEMSRAGVALYAGTPQYNRYSDWKFWYDDELWRKHINPGKIPVAVFAGGAGHPKAKLTPEEFAEECAEDRKTRKILKERTKHALCFTVRDAHSHALLNRLDIPNTYLPCSATFSGLSYRIQPDVVEGRVAIVSPKPTFVHEAKPEHVIERFLAIHNAVREEGYRPVMVCHTSRGYEAYRDILPASEVFYSNDYHALLKYYARCEGIISARLHATLPAYGIGSISRVVNVSVDIRGNAVDPLGIPNLAYHDATPDRVLGLFLQNRIDDEQRTRRLKEVTRQYGTIIRRALTEADWLQ